MKGASALLSLLHARLIVPVIIFIITIITLLSARVDEVERSEAGRRGK